jgi:hypothetical protein
MVFDTSVVYNAWGRMSTLQHAIEMLGMRVKQVLAIIAAIVVLSALVYRFVFAFTPPWLDFVVVIAAGLAMLLLWLLGRNRTFDYSAPVKKSNNARGDDHDT